MALAGASGWSGRSRPRSPATRRRPWGSVGAGREAVGLLDITMIRTGYLRWEIEVQDVRSPDDRQAREAIFLARPSYRIVRVKSTGHIDAAERFVRGEATYDSLLRTLQRHGSEIDVMVPDV